MRHCLILSAMCLTAIGCGNDERILKLWDQFHELDLQAELEDDLEKEIAICDAALDKLRNIESLDPSSIDPHTANADSDRDIMRVDDWIRLTELRRGGAIGTLSLQNAAEDIKQIIKESKKRLGY